MIKTPNKTINVSFSCNSWKDLIPYYLLAIIVLLLWVSACSKEGIDIDLPDTHLEQTPSGFWLSIFDLDYGPKSECIKKQILDKLRKNGVLLDEYQHKEGANKVKTYVWDYAGYTIKEQYYKGGIWEGPKIIPYQEYHRAGWTVWITVEFETGIPYSKLLPDHYMKINLNRKYEHTATIESAKDQGRRLFLFGYGSLCQRISLF
jgi:hypothetical protein